MTTGATVVLAGIYCRISLAGIGDTTKTDDQARIVLELLGRLDWPLNTSVGYPLKNGIYVDHNRSAWQKNRKRAGWDQMLLDVETGQLNALGVYHGDRLIRQPWDLETLLNLADQKGVRLASPTGVRNLDNADDRFILRIEAAQACRQSDDTSRRRKAQYERWRREGKVRPGGRGGRAFGFATDGVTHVPQEAGIVQAAAIRVLAGEGTGSIARDFAARGVLTPAGRPMTGATLRKMLARPRYAGLMPDGVHPAAWAPVLDRGDWEMVGAILAAKAAGFGYATNARRWLLSGIAVCGACWTPLAIRQSKGRAGRPPQTGYGCVRDGCRKVHRDAALLDAYVTGRVLRRLAESPAAEVDLRDGLAAELASLTARRAETEEFIASLADAPARRIAVLNRALDGFDAKIGELRERMAGSAASRLLATHAGITRDDFAALPLDVRRALVRACYKVIVEPASKRGPGFRTEDVILVSV